MEVMEPQGGATAIKTDEGLWVTSLFPCVPNRPCGGVHRGRFSESTASIIRGHNAENRKIKPLTTCKEISALPSWYQHGLI